ncbi:hypothetical protein LTR10_008369 [Elasticomyces elasticus]|nr:hypothetical protein LTR10_008369 [Elasticomyces elasticus]KAK4967243.1 hypothetical protein LTR42_010592 [Elasticomyces elasticus]
MEPIEVLSMLGFPARLAGRMPVVARYLCGPPKALKSTDKYALARYGPTIAYRPWLRLDMLELEQIERLINESNDNEVLQFRQTQLASGGMNTVVGSLLAAACATMLTLDSLFDVNLTVRALFTISLMLSLMSVYFTLVRYASSVVRQVPQRCEIGSAMAIIVRENQASKTPREAPFELLSFAISLFMGGVAAYLGLAMRDSVTLGTGPHPNNEDALIAFVVCTAFTLLVYGQALGQKDAERARSEEARAAP